MAETTPTAEPRVPLSRERVLEAAIALADGGGIESLTMRKLAQELGVEAMSLYNYVANKDDLLDGIVDLVVGEFELPCRRATGRRRSARARSPPTRCSCATPGRAASCCRRRRVSQPARLRYMDSLSGGFARRVLGRA